MNGILWILQVLLALLFFVTGAMKIVRTKEQLVKQMGWVKDTHQQVVWLIGVLEILGAVGLILPSLTGILPWLTPLAAAGLGLTMVGATITNYRFKEFSKIGLTVVILGLTIIVMVGRF